MRKILSAALALVCIWFATPALALPYGYTQLEYIESTGTQYIDTGVKDTSKLQMGINVTQRNSNYTILYGSQKTGTVVRRVASIALSSPYSFAINVGSNSSASIVNTGVDATLGVFHNLTLVFGTTAQIIENGITYTAPDSGDNASTGLNDFLFTYNYGGTPNYNVKAKISYARIYGANGTLIRNLVPAKNASGVIGMYDTVNNRFYTNAGTGEFVAGDPVTDNSCRNLLDTTNQLMPCYILADGTERCNEQDFEMSKTHINVVEGEQYTLSWIAGSSQATVKRIHGYDANGNWKGQIAEQRTEAAGPYSITITIPSGVKSVLVSGKRNIDTDMQLERGSTATAYVPYCSSSIKIATTKYNESAFGPLNTALQNAISVVDSVVSNTITQAASIATLQAQKQTRPNDIADDNEKCPAGKKCLLVEDANGVPHWYEIVTGRLPDGYTELEYIESTGTQYIDTNVLVTDDISWEGRFLSKNDTSKAASIFGYRWTETPTAQGNMRFVFIYPDGTFAVRFGVDASRTNLVMSGAETVTLKCEKDKFYANGSLFYTETRKNNEGEPQSGYLFNVNALNTVDISPVKMKLYYFKMWDDGTLVRDFVPALNPDGKIGMYDTVNGVFYENKGTGTFIGGQPVFN